MNITLSINDRLVEKARRIARASGTSLNQMIRDLSRTEFSGHLNKGTMPQEMSGELMAEFQ